MKEKYKVVGLGELLWDMLPDGKQLGGAPANFAYITSLLGDEGVPASRLGNDPLGHEALERLHELDLPVDFVQSDSAHVTGTVKIEIDKTGQPCFEISESVAWDFLQWTTQWRQLAEQTDAVCFGSLAQRSVQSRSTIRNFVGSTRPDAVSIFDVNLRQHFYSAEILSQSMRAATIVKLNHEELPQIVNLLALDHINEEASAKLLVETYNLKLLCITRGHAGSLLINETRSVAHPGFRVHVADTVGAGDAFTAAMVHEYLRGASLEQMSDTANRVGAWVASSVGATPRVEAGELSEKLARFGCA